MLVSGVGANTRLHTLVTLIHCGDPLKLVYGVGDIE